MCPLSRRFIQLPVLPTGAIFCVLVPQLPGDVPLPLHELLLASPDLSAAPLQRQKCELPPGPARRLPRPLLLLARGLPPSLRHQPQREDGGGRAGGRGRQPADPRPHQAHQVRYNRFCTPVTVHMYTFTALRSTHRDSERSLGCFD